MTCCTMEANSPESTESPRPSWRGNTAHAIDATMRQAGRQAGRQAACLICAGLGPIQPAEGLSHSKHAHAVLRTK